MNFLIFASNVFKGLLKKTPAKSDNALTWWAEKKLKHLPANEPNTCKILGNDFHFTDGAAFWHTYKELFREEIYKFDASNNPQPLIIDCGANIGLSVLYFKSIYPDAKIIAFEPDEKNFTIAGRNIKNYQLTNVELHQKAVWNETKELRFLAEGTQISRIVENEKIAPSPSVVTMQAVRLRDYLTQSIDFLKIDIEGAEFEVMEDIRDRLHLVKNLFVEYHSKSGEPQQLHQILNWMHAAGFRIHIHEACHALRRPFVDKNPLNMEFDLQLNMYGFR